MACRRRSRRRRGQNLQSVPSAARSKAGEVIQKVLKTGTKVSDTLRKKICGQAGSGIKQIGKKRSKRWGRSLMRDIPRR